MRASFRALVTPAEIQPDESFVELDTPPPTPRPEALLQTLQPLLRSSEIEALLLEEDRTLSSRQERSDAESHCSLSLLSFDPVGVWPQTPPSTAAAAATTSVGRGLPAPPRPRLGRLDIRPDQGQGHAPLASARRSRRPSAASRTAPGSSVSSPARSASVLTTIEALNAYSEGLFPASIPQNPISYPPPHRHSLGGGRFVRFDAESSGARARHAAGCLRRIHTRFLGRRVG